MTDHTSPIPPIFFRPSPSLLAGPTDRTEPRKSDVPYRIAPSKSDRPILPHPSIFFMTGRTVPTHIFRLSQPHQLGPYQSDKPILPEPPRPDTPFQTDPPRSAPRHLTPDQTTVQTNPNKPIQDSRLSRTILAKHVVTVQSEPSHRDIPYLIKPCLTPHDDPIRAVPPIFFHFLSRIEEKKLRG